MHKFGLTYSKGGVSLSSAKHGRKRRKNYPLSWGCAPEKMKMKKRVLTVWDGQRRLAKDDMMLGQDFEVRIPLPQALPEAGPGDQQLVAGQQPYITDLDVQTLRRTEAFFGANEEERGPWLPTNLMLPDSAVAAAAIESGGAFGPADIMGCGQLVA